jgi:hypothetical protein
LESSPEAHLERAFALAFFFHPHRATALGIAARALSKLRLAERTQVRRAYYRPSGRRFRHGRLSLRSRTKVSLERTLLLQRLVLHECELYEREQEPRGDVTLGDDDFVLRFIKHLVRIATRRSSLYVAVAIGRILHGYGTAEVQELLGTVVQDPDRVPEDSYLRHVKRGLFLDLQERFGALLRTKVGPRGEESFETAPPSPRQRFLVTLCLELLTPWDTTCPVPAGFDAITQPLRPLRFVGRDPDAEHAIEVKRMHALIHPDCFLRLATGLRLDPPFERLTLPRPFRSSDTGGAGGGGDRSRPPSLAGDELEELGTLWSREERSRHTAPLRRVAVWVDGRKRLELEAGVDASAACDLGEGAEVLEVRSEPERALPLAIQVLQQDPVASEDVTVRDEIVVGLPGGRELVLAVIAGAGEQGARSVRLEASCRAASMLSRLLGALGAGGSEARGVGRRLVPAAGLLLLAGVVGLVALWRDPADRTLEVARAPIDGSSAEERTRGPATSAQPTTLAAARYVFLDALSGPYGEQVAGLLWRELERSGRFEPTADRDAADVALKAALATEVAPGGGASTVRLELSLVDERGEVLWSRAARAASWEVAVGEAIADLVGNREH